MLLGGAAFAAHELPFRLSSATQKKPEDRGNGRNAAKIGRKESGGKTTADRDGKGVWQAAPGRTLRQGIGEGLKGVALHRRNTSATSANSTSGAS